VLYRINIDNTGDGRADIVYEFRFDTTIRNPNTFLYNTGPIDSLSGPNFNRPQTYTLTEVRGGLRKVLGNNLPTPPCNIGPRSTPNYADLANAAITKVGNGIAVFAGQRLDGFYVDLGSVFDLAVLRPFQNLHAIPTPAVPGVNALRAFNVHTIAIQVPITQLTRNSCRPSDVLDARSVIGVWASAHRQKSHYRDENRDAVDGAVHPGVPAGQSPVQRGHRADEPEGPLEPTGAVPGFAVRQVRGATGIRPAAAGAVSGSLPASGSTESRPCGSVGHSADRHSARTDSGVPELHRQDPGGSAAAECGIPPSPSPHINGILGGDLAGFPNGRRVFDNVVAIELRAVAGATYPLVDPTFVPDGASGVLTDLTDGPNPPDTVSYLTTFPYLDHPVSGDRIVPLSVPA
jgi:hypothetical protein